MGTVYSVNRRPFHALVKPFVVYPRHRAVFARWNISESVPILAWKVECSRLITTLLNLTSLKTHSSALKPPAAFAIEVSACCSSSEETLAFLMVYQ